MGEMFVIAGRQVTLGSKAVQLCCMGRGRKGREVRRMRRPWFGDPCRETVSILGMGVGGSQAEAERKRGARSGRRRRGSTDGRGWTDCWGVCARVWRVGSVQAEGVSSRGRESVGLTGSYVHREGPDVWRWGREREGQPR